MKGWALRQAAEASNAATNNKASKHTMRNSHSRGCAFVSLPHHGAMVRCIATQVQATTKQCIDSQQEGCMIKTLHQSLHERPKSSAAQHSVSVSLVLHKSVACLTSSLLWAGARKMPLGLYTRSSCRLDPGCPYPTAFSASRPLMLRSNTPFPLCWSTLVAL